VGVGVVSRDLTVGDQVEVSTTTPAYIPCLISIKDMGGSIAPPAPDVYDQIMDLLNKYIQGGGGSGESGFSPTIEVSAIEGGHRLTITDVNGTKTVDVMDGKDGKDGEDGEKGDKGDPYTLTDADKSAIVQDVINALPNGDEVAY
jgi:hypothetical protein